MISGIIQMACSRVPGSWNQEPSVTSSAVFRPVCERSCRLASNVSSDATSLRENPPVNRPAICSHGVSLAFSKLGPSFK